MRDNWKLIVTITTAVIVLFLVGLRMKHSFAPQAPSVLNYEQHTSPSFTFNSDLRHAWKNVESFTTLAQREERATLLRLANLTFVHVCKLPNEALVWDTIEMRNPGFEPLHRVERSEPGKVINLVGYYSLEGKPLDYDTKVDLRNKQQTLTTVDLAEPLEAGKSVLFFRVQRTTSRISTNTPGKCIVSLGRLPAGASTIHATGLALPKKVVLEKYSTEGAEVHELDNMSIVTWLSSRSDNATRNVQVTFSIPK